MERKMKIASIINDYKLAINAGSNSGIKLGQRYLLYVLSDEEILDPDTKESLGYLEIVKGVGKITHVQEKISTLESDSYRSTKRISQGNPWSGIFIDALEEAEYEKEQLPFENPQIGDLLKRIN